MTPAAAQARAAWDALFDEAEWLRLPLGRAVHRSDCRPCGACGGTRFAVLVRRIVVGAEGGNASARTDLRVACAADACRRQVRRRDDEREVGVVDAKAGTYAHNRSDR